MIMMPVMMVLGSFNGDGDSDDADVVDDHFQKCHNSKVELEINSTVPRLELIYIQIPFSYNYTLLLRHFETWYTI